MVSAHSYEYGIYVVRRFIESLDNRLVSSQILVGTRTTTARRQALLHAKEIEWKSYVSAANLQFLFPQARWSGAFSGLRLLTSCTVQHLLRSDAFSFV